MSLRKGTKLIAGNGSAPYIDPVTGNWAIGGVDTGIQAVQTKVTIDEYNNLVKTGTIDDNLMYFITDVSPVVYTDKRVLASSWVSSGSRYTNTISIPGVKTSDTIMVDIAASTSDDVYVTYKSALDDAGVLRVRSTTDAIVIVSSSPVNMDLLVDITVTKCIIGE